MGAFVVVFFAFVLIMLLKIVKQATGLAEDENAPVETREAELVAKRTNVSGGANGSVTRYYLTFEFGDGSRCELRAEGSAYGLLAEGDRGVLRSRGSSLLSFSRQENVLPAQEPADVSGWHKCEACGATFRGPVCDYCGTPLKLN